jgi:PKD repeat protein
MKNMNRVYLLLIILTGLMFACKKPEPLASFTVNKTTAPAGEEVSFTNTSSDATSFYWDFGDGTNSAEQNPSHSYSSPGTYTVTLTATGEGGSNSVSKSLTITLPVNIVPGSSAMNISLAETWQTVQSKLGTGYTQYGPILLTSGSTSYVIHPLESKSKGIYLYFLSLKSSFTLSTSDVVFLIVVKQNFVGQTAKGIKIGSTLPEISAAYGPPEEHNTTYYYYDYNSIGISFYYDKATMKVDEIFISTPSKKGASEETLLMEYLDSLKD